MGLGRGALSDEERTVLDRLRDEQLGPLGTALLELVAPSEVHAPAGGGWSGCCGPGAALPGRRLAGHPVAAVLRLRSGHGRARRIRAVHAWPAPDVPALPGTGLALRLHDTATGEIRPTAPGPVARMYVCGITPYDATHIGHAATYVAFDLVHRVWLRRRPRGALRAERHRRRRPAARAGRARRRGLGGARRARDRALPRGHDGPGVLPPRDYIGAVEAIPRIVERVERLRDPGAAYDVDGDIYFSVAQRPALRRRRPPRRRDDAAAVRRARRRPGAAGQEAPARLPALAGRASGRAVLGPATSLPAGRPGWHIECAAIALDHLGSGFDVQGGGTDLAFPHHEMGASEAQVLTGEWPFARHYVHAGMVGLDGEKMSKSKGNLVFVSALRRDGRDPMAIRLALLAHHYRADWEWTEAGPDAPPRRRLARWRDAVVAGRPARRPTRRSRSPRRHLADDLDAPARSPRSTGGPPRRPARAGGTGRGVRAAGVVSRAVERPARRPLTRSI